MYDDNTNIDDTLFEWDGYDAETEQQFHCPYDLRNYSEDSFTRLYYKNQREI